MKNYKFLIEYDGSRYYGSVCRRKIPFRGNWKMC